MSYIIGTPPYYDTFDSGNNFVSLLFVPGVSLQNRELNELQSILKYQIKQIGDSIFTDGDIIEGCQIIIPEGSGTKVCTITAGKLYLNGDIRVIEETKITIRGVGEEKIGVKIVATVITQDKKPDLIDVAAGFANYRESGAHRLQEDAKIVLNNDEASTLWNLKDGELINAGTTEDISIIDKITSTLARRTYDESGNYKVWGLEMSPKSVLNDEFLYLSVAAGKAYVKGFEIYKQTATTIPLERANTLRAVNSEPKAYTAGQSLYALNNPPVNEITKAVGTVSMTMQMTRGGIINSTDPIPEMYRPLVDIQNIVQVGNGHTYIKGQDYSVFGDTVSWALNGNEPASGESYTITFTYNKTLVYGNDYDLHNQDNLFYLRLLKNFDNPDVDENGSTVNGIVNGSAMNIDYNFMLYYMAVITLDQFGNLRVVKGQPDIRENVSKPDINDTAILVLGDVLLTPSNDSLVINNDATTRLEFWELQEMVQRLWDMEYNQAVTDLDNEAMLGEEPTLLKGIYTDGFIGFSKCDVHYDNAARGIKFNCAIDMDNRELTLSTDIVANNLQVKERNDINPPSSATTYHRLITAKATETKAIGQPYATKVMLVNPYQVFPDRPALAIFPEVDSWMDTSNVTLTNNVVVNQSGGTKVSMNYVWGSWGGTSTSQTSSTTSKTTKSATTRVLESAIVYMRQISITLTGKKFGSFRDNIWVKFNDISVTPTPSNSVYKGTLAGSLRSDANGEIKATITVPSNVLCGTVEVTMWPDDDKNFIAAATYTANGTQRVIQNIITNTTVNTTTVFKTITQFMVRNVDPLAQTFKFEKAQMITSVGLHFAVVDPNHDVIIQLRGADNGYPSSVGYAQKILKASECLPSVDSSIETKVTFDDPVYIEADEEYSFVIMTESATTSMYYADIGGRDILTNVQVLKNPYLEGVMFSSSNATAWTAHQSSDLKFNVYNNAYDPTSYVYFDELLPLRYSGIMLQGSTEVPVDTELTFEYSRDSGATWYPISINNDIELSSLLTKVTIRAKFTAKENVSPVIAIDSMAFIGMLNSLNSEYISRNIELDKEYTSVKQIVDINAPVGTNVTMYYCYDVNGMTWYSVPQTGFIVKDANGYIQYTFEDTLGGAGSKNYRVRIALTTNNPCIRPKVTNLRSILK